MTASANNTTISPALLTDATGAEWSITPPNGATGDQVCRNGVVDTRTLNVKQMLYSNGVIYHENMSSMFYAYINGGWVRAAGDPRVESPSGTTITAPGLSLTDASLEQWTLVSGGNGYQIAVNGAVLTETAQVKLLLFFNGLVYQENSAGYWWSKGKSGDSWTTASDPRVAPTPTPTPTPTPDPLPTPLPTPLPDGPTPPAQAVAAGYKTCVFGASGFTSNSVSPDNTGTHDWYPFNGFDGTSEPKPSQWTVNSDGSLTFLTEASYNGLVTVNSHTPAVSKPSAHATNQGQGLAFQYGYFEATLKFDPTLLGKNPGWPSFWGAMVSGFTSAPYMELDIIEAYANSSWPGVGKANLISTVHQWLDGSGDQFNNSNNTVPNQASIDLTQPHKYGCLWTPTAITFYIDDKETLTVPTTAAVATQIASNSGKSSSTGNNTFTVANSGGAIYLQLGTGVNFPVTFSNVRVFQ